MGDYPTGTTQRAHDAAFDAADENAIMRVIEDRADDEIAGRSKDDPFAAWLTDRDDPASLALIVQTMAQGDPDVRVDALLSQLRKDYIDYRADAAMVTGEWDEIAAELRHGEE